ncbi:hypothetical protein [Cellulosimicrobium cellulans]|uniref:hypothetical protein n=1 Tax=Cellulosimicrobium cellulans TaxID=1710 RepID=UPI000B0AD48B|nr:hypothetical protein [Cellulosimicrobium cellulans]
MTTRTPPSTPPTSCRAAGPAAPAPDVRHPHGDVPPHPHRRRGGWVAPAATAWWAAGGALTLGVTLLGGTLPVGSANDTGFGALQALPGETLTPWVAVLALVGAALAAWTWLGGRRHPVARPVRTVTVAAVALVLAGAVALVDASILARLGYLPVTLVMAPFDPDLRAAFQEFVTPGTLLQVAVLLGGALLAASTARFVRRAAGACESCGRRPDGADPAWTAPASAARWGRVAALVAAAIPTFYAVTRIAWVLGIPLGFAPDDVAELAGNDGWIAALGLGGFALVGAVLTLGLYQRWGEVFPRWMVGLAGRRVPVLLAVVPATVVAVAVLPAGLSLVAAGLEGGQLALTADSWGAVGPALLWPLWSVALGAATYAYWLRRRGTCRTCGRG